MSTDDWQNVALNLMPRNLPLALEVARERGDTSAEEVLRLHHYYADHCGGWEVLAWPCPTAARVLIELGVATGVNSEQANLPHDTVDVWVEPKSAPPSFKPLPPPALVAPFSCDMCEGEGWRVCPTCLTHFLSSEPGPRCSACTLGDGDA